MTELLAIKKTQWFEGLVLRCKDHLSSLDKSILKTYWCIGDELVKDGYNPKTEQWRGKKTKGRLSLLAKEIGKSQTSVREAYRLRMSYPDLHNAIVKVKSWYLWVNRFKKKGTETFPYQIYNVWKTFKLDPEFGERVRFLGESPHQIIENLLHYYTHEGNIVLDPMAGGGVTIDVCKLMNRKYVAFDIDPLRSEIQKNNILNGIPINTKVNFVFLDPPYYKQHAYEDCKFTKSLQDFYEAMETTLKNCYEVLQEGGFLALMLKPMGLHEGNGFEWGDLTLETHIIAKKLHFKLVKRICSPLSTQQYSGLDVTRAKKGRYMLNTLRDILVYQK